MKLIKFNPNGDYFKQINKDIQNKLLNKGEMTLDEFFEIDQPNQIVVGRNGFSIFSNGSNPDFTIREDFSTRDSKMNLSETLNHLKELIG